ncbi:polysaccharide deacetylase family protein [Marinomonas sp. M1K-6]|uniref:Polysaccharide deacetylase family protein n=1 Tax=Marinomonas profundi TaxID=2726122 RepID=A0A847RA71_9GAMM|nr:polysaccharide deacetylase family protein [Marinomonas profundi]NLQ18067.1 polysaccharide deacetylase family protein [Marinomonas profundi]UDV04145.1 polysaccharide deacetylase family protein [Marinomonas profundi]
MLSTVRSSLLLGALSASMALQAQDYLPILQYHHVSESSPKSTSVTPAQFTEHMDYLVSAGFQVVDLKSALDDLKANKALPEKAVAITFDDAYRNIYQAGFPILKARDFPFTVFINTYPVERKSRSFLTWEQMQEMQAAGGVFANHTINHPYMLRKEAGETDEVWFARMVQEVDTVEALLIKHLGESPKMLAYPYGESDRQIRTMMKDRGIMAFGQQSGVVSADSDFENLPRFPASGVYANLSTLKTKLNAKPMPLLKEKNGGDYAGDQPVSVRLTFKEGKYRFKDLACYVAGQGKAKLDWVSDTEVVAMAEKPFNVGRGRINCTMPDNTGAQYYWYSHVWIRSSPDQGYVSEKS